MRAWINDSLRAAIGISLRIAGALFQLRHRLRIRNFRSSQARLQRRYRIGPDTPISDSIGLPAAEQARRVSTIRRRDDPHGPRNPRLAKTSGSTGRPKEIPYTNARLRAVRFTFIEVFLRCFWYLDVARTSLYVFGSLDNDESLTALLLEETRTPSRLAILQAPYRVERHPALQDLRDRYGTGALRLWIVSLSNPGVLYSTNPSTLSTFFDELSRNWHESTALVRDYVRKPHTFPASIHRIVRRLVSRGGRERLERIAASPAFMPIQEWAPGLDTYVCWMGGYVAPFLERVRTWLPAPRYRLVPMYSMSTETIETITHFDRNGIAFLPVAPGVLYEFLQDDASEKPGNLKPASRLRKGKTYRMLVSHPYGARRYRTGDVFLVKEWMKGIPDLRFLRRSGLAYSFTGEKLTGEQLAEAFGKIRGDYPSMDGADFLTCFPSQPDTDPIPHYKLTLIRGDGFPGCVLPGIAERCDRLLAELNPEYRNKRKSRRLGPVRFQQMNATEFLRRMGAGPAPPGLDGQFKFLPLYPRLWESLDRP